MLLMIVRKSHEINLKLKVLAGKKSKNKKAAAREFKIHAKLFHVWCAQEEGLAVAAFMDIRRLVLGHFPRRISRVSFMFLEYHGTYM